VFRKKPADSDGKGLRQQAQLLEKQFLQKDRTSDKIQLKEEMAYMRRELEKNKTEVNLTYPVNPPYAFINVTFDKRDGEFEYLLREPSLSTEEQANMAEAKQKMELLIDQEGIPLADEALTSKSERLRSFLKDIFEEVLYLYDIEIPEDRKPVVFYHLRKELIGMGRVDAVLKDPFIEDVSCNGPKEPIYIYHRVFGSMKTNVVFPREIELNKFIFRLAQISGKHISVYQPILDAVLDDGSRINLTLGSEVTRKGSTFSIRKFSHDPISPIDLLRYGSLSADMLAYFWLLIEHKKSILISGGTATGKTTLLNALCMLIRPEDKIVSIEDTPEIKIDHENWIQSVSRKGYGKASGVSGVSGISGVSGGSGPGDIDLYDLLVAALRQRPEYVIVGEVRGREAFTLFQAISVGHASLGTIHAGSMRELLPRVENEPMNVPRVLFQNLDAVAFMNLITEGDRRIRRLRNVTEVLEIERDTKNLLTNDAFNWHPKQDAFSFSGRSFNLESLADSIGKTADDLLEEMQQRTRYIRLMNEHDVTHYKDVSRAINMYYVNPIQAMLELEQKGEIA